MMDKAVELVVKYFDVNYFLFFCLFFVMTKEFSSLEKGNPVEV